jgi:serine/threonine protein kinase
VVVYELFTNTAPFFGDDEDALYSHIKLCRPEIPRYLTRDAADLLHGFLTKNPDTRLGSVVAGRNQIKVGVCLS